jgi:prolipoprotein diacylglyceryl transferase
MTLAYIPSPSQGVWHLGPLPVRAYALCIILGVIVAVLIGERRWVARGGPRGAVADMAGVAVPFGLVGGRMYHVITSPSQYLDHPIEALYIWRGGLGIPGGILGGVIAGVIFCRRRRLSAAAMADAIAPGVPIAQAIGRFGNYFNQELFGRPTHLPWGLEIDPDNADAVPGAEAYHPTFLYEALWNVGVAGVVIWADRRWRLGRGRAFALYLALYAVGRSWVEALRIDDAHRFFGLRLNDYVAAAVFVGATTYLVRKRGTGREDTVQEVRTEESDVTLES